jgi:hypothetical protein
MHKLYHRLQQAEAHLDAQEWVVTLLDGVNNYEDHIEYARSRVLYWKKERNRILRLFDFLLDNGGEYNG